MTCEPAAKNDNRAQCRGIAGLAMTNLAIMDRHNTTGLTLVLEDDYRIRNMTLLKESLNHVPSDFDVVRWGCYGLRPEEFQQVNKHVYRTACIDKSTGEEVE